MNFFKNLPLTTKILAGVAGVGAAALVGYGVLTAPEDGGNAFFDNGRQRIEYVAGASNGMPEQDLISSKNVKFVDDKFRQQESEREALEMGNDPVTYGPLGVEDTPTEGASISHGAIGLVNGGVVEDTSGIPSISVPGMGDLAGLVGGAAGSGAQGGPGAGGAGGAGSEGGTQRATLERVDGAKALKAPGANGFGNGIVF